MCCHCVKSRAMLFGTDRRRFLWDLKQRNFFCVRLRPHSLWTQAGKRSTLGCGCRDSLYTGLGAALLSLPMSLSSGSRHRGGERVTYLDLLNSFHQWQKSNYLPGNARLRFYSFHSLIRSGKATSCQGANSENNTRSSWQKWGVAARDAGHFFS